MMRYTYRCQTKTCPDYGKETVRTVTPDDRGFTTPPAVQHEPCLTEPRLVRLERRRWDHAAWETLMHAPRVPMNEDILKALRPRRLPDPVHVQGSPSMGLFQQRDFTGIDVLVGGEKHQAQHLSGPLTPGEFVTVVVNGVTHRCLVQQKTEGGVRLQAL